MVYKQIKSDRIKASRVGRNFIVDKKDSSDILNKELNEKEKLEIEKVVKKIMDEYGEALKILSKM